MAVAVRPAMLLLGAGGFVSGMNLRVAEPLLPRLADELGVSIAAAAILITGFTFAYGLFQLAHGPLGDRFGKLRMVMLMMLLAGLASAACATADSLDELALYRFAVGMTSGAVIPLSFAFVGDTIAMAERQQVLGRFISGVLIGTTLGPLLGGVVSDAFGWRATFAVTALAFGVIGAALVPLALREQRSRSRAVPLGVVAVYLGLLRDRRVRTICAVVSIEGFAFYGAFAYLGAYLRETFALTYTVIGLSLAGFGIGGIVYSLTVGPLVRGLGPRRMVRLGGWLLAFGFGALSLAPGVLSVTALVALLGFAFYLLHNTLQTRATEMAPHARGAAVALFAFGLFFGQALGAGAIGVGIQWLGYGAVFVITGAVLAVLALWFAERLAAL